MAMDLDKTLLADSWKELEALENETKLLLETIRGKPKNNKDKTSKPTNKQAKLKQKETDNIQKRTTNKKQKSLNQLNELDSTRILFPDSRVTIEILDDASPDITPRLDEESDNYKKIKLMKQHLYDIQLKEKQYRKLQFDEEKTRVLQASDTFVPGPDISIADIENERKRLIKLEETAKFKTLKIISEINNQKNYLLQDRNALKIQSIFRGYIGRQKYLLTKSLDNMKSKDDTSDWILVSDPQTGDTWYYNKKNGKSQWNKPLSGISNNPKTISNSTTNLLPKINNDTEYNMNSSANNNQVNKRTLEVSMSLPSLEALNMSSKLKNNIDSKSPQKKTKKTLSFSAEVLATQKELEAKTAADHELGFNKISKMDGFLAPDGTFKPQLRTVVLDALIDSRFDSVSTVIADSRWCEEDKDHFNKKKKKTFNNISTNRTLTGEEKAFVPMEEDISRIPIVSELVINKKKPKQGKSISASDYDSKNNSKDYEIEINDDTDAKDFTFNSIEHKGFDEQNRTDMMCFGCWSSGLQRKCELHQGNSKLKPSQTMLLCRNWDLDVMRRRYRAEEIQELFLKNESSLRYDSKYKKFSTVTEQKHPIYRSRNQINDLFNNRLILFEKIKFWLNSMAEELRIPNPEFPKNRVQIISQLLRLKRTMVAHAKVTRYTKLNQSLVPVAPITGYSWPERLNQIQFLFKHYDVALATEVDLIMVYPIPIPKQLYLPRVYHLGLPKNIPMPKPSYKDNNPALRVLPNNTYIPDDNGAAWVEKMAASISRDCLLAAKAQVKAFTPVGLTEMLIRTKNPVPCSIKSATIGRKPTPENKDVGGLPLELLIYQLISTFIPVQYGNFMVMDKGTISPGISPEVNISFVSIVMPPIVQYHIIRALEHPLNYRRAPTITLNSNVLADEGKHFYGINRPEQTGEQAYYGFRTTTWAPMLLTYSETDPQVFVPGQGVVSLNDPKANISYTTHADSTYPFCEPSTRDNSTLDFYHLLLTGVVSASKPQIFTALTVQEPGQFMKAYDSNAPMGHLLVNIYRSWAFTQNDTIQEFRTDDGISYWYHRKTGQTFWERPLYESEEVSPLEGGTILDLVHPEEPLLMSKSSEGATRRYTQGEFRNQMLAHIETKKDALNRRKAASVTLKYAKQRGVIPELVGFASIANNGQSSSELLTNFDFEKTYNSSMMNSNLPSHELENEMGEIVNVDQDYHQNQYNNSISPMSANHRPHSNNHMGLIPGAKLDEGSYAVNNNNSSNNFNHSSHGHQFIPKSASSNEELMQDPYSSVMGPMGGSAMPGVDPNIINNLSTMIGAMMTNMMMMDSSNPQNMIQLGLGMGMALMSTGAVNNMVGVPDNSIPNTRQSNNEEANNIWNNNFDKPNTGQSERMFPSLSEEEESVLSAESHNNKSVLSRVSLSNPMSIFNSKNEPIGLAHPTAIYAADKVLDHEEEEAQKIETSQRIHQPLNTMEAARNLKVNMKATETPDVAPPKVLTIEKPSNQETGVRNDKTIPLLAYPELSTILPDGAPLPFHMKTPAGLGTSFVSPDERETQKFVPGGENLRRTVMPLPVGFFEAIEAKHVAQQAADYLPQVPNMPQARNIGRVKPRSAAADWLMINFDPWSAGKNPLSTEYVKSLLEKTEKFTKGGAAKAADEVERLRKSAVEGAFTKLEDEEGLAQQRADITRAEVLANDFKKLCSLCRHAKFTDAEELVNQPDWSVPIDYQDEQGNTLLHIVAQNGNRRMVKLCLRRGANLDMQNLTGQTALHFAYGYGYAEVGDYILSKGADDSIRNKDGLTCYEGLGSKELEYL